MHSLLKEACSVLGVAEDADADAIAAAFKALAMKWHPDRNKDNVEEATARFAELSAARDLLLDPPPQLLLPDAPTAAAAQAAAEDAQRAALRAYDKSTDVTDALRSGSLDGAATLFEQHQLWAVWYCTQCELVCCRIRKDKYNCICGCRLAAHDASRGMRCGTARCKCAGFEWQVQCEFEPLKCGCKHPAKDHAAPAPWRCTRPGCSCEGFHSHFQCNCGHGHGAHETRYVRKYYTPRCREWVVSGLRAETVALARKFRARGPAQRDLFVRRAVAAREAGASSWKALQRQQQLDRETAARDRMIPGRSSR